MQERKMGLFRKNKGTPLKELERYHGKRVSYVVEREGAEENVIGRKNADIEGTWNFSR